MAADVLCQEYGRYFQMPVGVFRGGCLTGPDHAAVELHGFLNYIVRCAVLGKRYTIFGYGGNRCAIRFTRPTWRICSCTSSAPRCGEVYNLGWRARQQPVAAGNDRRARGTRVHAGLPLRRSGADGRSHLLHLRPPQDSRAFPRVGAAIRWLRILDEIVARFQNEVGGSDWNACRA